MGEAKRRQGRVGGDTEYRDLLDDQVKPARIGGDPIRVLTAWQNAIAAERAGTRLQLDVPCRGCTQCCYHAGVDVDPAKETAIDLMHMDLVPRDGVLMLRKREDGACVHLGPDGCTIHEHRPSACRTYDCRAFSLVNMRDKYDGDHVQPVWLFQPDSERSDAFLAAAQFGSMVAVARRRASNEGFSASDVLLEVLNDPEFPKKMGAVHLLKTAPDHIKTEILRKLGGGREPTREEALAVMRRMLTNPAEG
jgi:hypothetical protein